MDSKRSAMPWRLGLALATMVLAVATASATPVVWSFNVETEGEDVFWNSPTPVDPAADRYFIAYEITGMWATGRAFGVTIEQDILGELSPEEQANQGIVNGPAPTTIFDDTVFYPDEIDPGFSATITMGINSAGYGQVSATNIVLGVVYVDFPPFGTIPVTLLGLRLEGTLTVEPLYLGDMNCDGVTDVFDINPFVDAILDPVGYAAAYPDCYIENGDINDDSVTDVFDINPFVDLILGS